VRPDSHRQFRKKESAPAAGDRVRRAAAGRAAPGAGGHTSPPTGIRSKRNVDSGQPAQREK
jgi:hypothetical protein